MTLPIGRFAPTPSGALHFGSLVAALASYCDIRSQQGSWLLRIEDVDTPRVVAGASDQILHDLSAFGFEWDGEILYQSTRFEHYRHYLDQLLQQGDSYACQCSRRSLRKQGVSSGPLGQVYPGNCRDKKLDRKGHSLRMSTAMTTVVTASITASITTAITGEVHFQDRVYGDFSMNLEAEVGDFVLQRSDLVYAYHLAVVVDDEWQGVNQIVRGADLLENTCLHLHLQQRLGFSQPSYLHLPLVSNAAGIKLSKQTGASPLDYDKASKLLMAALQHLGQQAPPELENESPANILQWSCDHWDPSLITARRSALAQTDDD